MEKMINQKKKRMYAGTTLILIAAGLLTAFTTSNPSGGDDDNWSKESQTALEAMTKKYGKPHEKTATMAVWHNTGPWKKTILHSKAVEHNFPKPHKDVLQQYIAYKVPVEKFNELAKYDGSVICERTNGLISATCDKEEMNFLAINLAHDIIKSTKTVEQAREYYARAAINAMKGNMDNYVKGLQFQPEKGETGDPDKMAEMDDMMKGVMSKEPSGKSK